MGRHARDEEPAPHPLDRTPRVPAEGRPAAPGRPHPGEAAGSARTAGRGEASGSYPAAGRSEASGSYPAAGRSEASGAFRTPKPKRSSISAAFGIAGRGAATGSARVPGSSEASGSYFVPGGLETAGSQPGRAESSGAHPVVGRGEATGSHPASRRSETSGAYPVASGIEATGSRPAAGRGESSGAYAVASRTEVDGSRPGETSGSYPVASPSGSRSAGRRGETPDAYPALSRGAAAGTGRRGGKSTRAARRSETAAERTEVITRHDEASGDYPITARSESSGSSRTRGRGEKPSRAGGRNETTGPHREDRSEGTGSHRTVGKVEGTGSHRIVGKKAPRRRIATWPIACLVLAALIGLGVIGWNWADSELNSRAEAQAASCSGGTSHMRVVVTPSVQKPLEAAAERWNQAATVVHGQCVHVMIEAKPSAQVLDALVGRAGLDTIGGLPAAWLPESSYWVSELTTKKPEMIGSPAQSVANARSADYPFIGLAGQGIDDTVLRAAQTFREYLEQPAQQADFAAAGIKAT